MHNARLHEDSFGPTRPGLRLVYAAWIESAARESSVRLCLCADVCLTYISVNGSIVSWDFLFLVISVSGRWFEEAQQSKVLADLFLLPSSAPKKKKKKKRQILKWKLIRCTQSSLINLFKFYLIFTVVLLSATCQQFFTRLSRFPGLRYISAGIDSSENW